LPALEVTVTNQNAGVDELVNVTTNSATGGSGAGTYKWTWAGDGDPLPPGLELNDSTGAVSGRPTAAGNYDVIYTVTDEIGSRTSVTRKWIITP
jgi:hypothetical protein